MSADKIFVIALAAFFFGFVIFIAWRSRKSGPSDAPGAELPPVSAPPEESPNPSPRKTRNKKR